MIVRSESEENLSRTTNQVMMSLALGTTTGILYSDSDLDVFVHCIARKRSAALKSSALLIPHDVC
jgi:hypothetical protein